MAVCENIVKGNFTHENIILRLSSFWRPSSFLRLFENFQFRLCDFALIFKQQNIFVSIISENKPTVANPDQWGPLDILCRVRIKSPKISYSL